MLPILTNIFLLCNQPPSDDWWTTPNSFPWYQSNMGDSGQSRLRVWFQANSLTPTPVLNPLYKKMFTPTPVPTTMVHLSCLFLFYKCTWVVPTPVVQKVDSSSDSSQSWTDSNTLDSSFDSDPRPIFLTPTPVLTSLDKKCWLRLLFWLDLSKKVDSGSDSDSNQSKKWSRLHAWLQLRRRNCPSLVSVPYFQLRSNNAISDTNSQIICNIWMWSGLPLGMC